MPSADPAGRPAHCTSWGRTKAGVDSWALSLLLLAPAALLLAGFAAQAITQGASLSGFATGTGLALSMLAVGYRLRTTTTTDRGAPAEGLAAG